VEFPCTVEGDALPRLPEPTVLDIATGKPLYFLTMYVFYDPNYFDKLVRLDKVRRCGTLFGE